MKPAGEGHVSQGMKTTQALNFFLVGLGMCFGPALWPQAFARGIVDTSALWLLVMGTMQAFFGAFMAGVNEVPRLKRWLAEWEPFSLNLKLGDVNWGLPEAFYNRLAAEEEIDVALGLQRQLRLGQAA